MKEQKPLTSNEQRHVLNAITTALRTSGFREHVMKVREGSLAPPPKHRLLGTHAPFERENLDVLFTLAQPSYIWLVTEAKPDLCESYFAVHIAKDEYEVFLAGLGHGERLAWEAALTHAHTIWRADTRRDGPRYRVRMSLLHYAHLYPDLTASVIAFASPQRLEGAQVNRLIRGRLAEH